MMRILLLIAFFLSSSLAQELPSDPDFAVQGEYAGPTRAMQVVAMGQGEFEVHVFAGGLPGAGWNRTAAQSLQLDAEEVAELGNSNQMKRIVRTSPSLGMKPPEDAIILFDGTQQSLERHWKTGAKRTDDGLLQQGATGTDLFQDFSLHIEFRTPYKPEARGQGRGNSGVYFQGRYEIQVLDSFGLEGKMNETGGIYSIRAPDLNMCLPPLAWQTYDVDFTAARFDAAGNKTTDARLTVRLNGVVVQPDVALTHATTAAPMKEGPEPGPIYLQDHNNPVQFRNIWVRPRDVAKEARRPIVPGFERFFSQPEQDQALGGRVLLSELGCVACHQTTIQDIVAKQAPILDQVGSRIRPDYLVEYLTDAHAAKPGSTMPLLLSHLPPSEREHSAQAIASFLAGTGSTVDRFGHPKLAARGKQIFDSVGCAACHAPQDGELAESASDAPLAGLARKYTLDSLTRFLQAPHAVRPSGRMPLLVQGQDASDVATYLLRDVVVGESLVNMKASFYRGNWQTLPNFDELKPTHQSEVYGLDLKAANYDALDHFAARFDGFFLVPEGGRYQFHLGSDDGSRLYVDGEVVIENDAVHPMQWKSKRIPLTEGRHFIRVEYFEQGGEEVLELEIEGGGVARVAFETLAMLDEVAKPNKPMPPTRFPADLKLVETGRELYNNLGCAACHALRLNDASVASTRKYPRLESLRSDQGCLNSTVPAGLPDYELSPSQRGSIQAALDHLRTDPTPLGDPQRIHATMASLNCYACHKRAGVGGPELSRDGVFQTTMKEMGDEGRLPPPLDGVGDKLRADYLHATLEKGADERAYMLVNMPGFGPDNVAALADALVRSDQRTESKVQAAEESVEQTKASGRLLAGSKGLSCVKCHTAGGKGSGIRAMDLEHMTSRLREDWFHRYMMSPIEYRPGTRMPASFPDGQSVLPDLYGGDPSLQLNALWQYLSDGKRAKLPIGAEGQLIELAATEQPILYRNFLDGLSPRGIGVGYPEGLNLAWDANSMALAQVWKGAFVDASKHWIGRGQGNQLPLGDQVVALESNSPIAILESIDAAWPAELARNRGYRFLGYRLSDGRPTFRYRLDDLRVEDRATPVLDPTYGKLLMREIALEGTAKNVVVHIASGRDIRVEGEWFVIDDQYAVRVQGEVRRVVRDGITSLRRQVDLTSGSASVVEEFRW